MSVNVSNASSAAVLLTVKITTTGQPDSYKLLALCKWR